MVLRPPFAVIGMALSPGSGDATADRLKTSVIAVTAAEEKLKRPLAGDML